MNPFDETNEKGSVRWVSETRHLQTKAYKKTPNIKKGQNNIILSNNNKVATKQLKKDSRSNASVNKCK